ncbi:hypothetical protein GMOD_00006461 [Pyrenophora seminiperda CCB06]|uniref:Uncharacterized protein n=1 Tax=Pyrenophora seminiperda CCB06 TaxID=1302712 RepID=A0A3M7M594_9PLEO|nr:hypothetical protein GMOD_00006461 [Pyrenophora seminiperda CCB06]
MISSWGFNTSGTTSATNPEATWSFADLQINDGAPTSSLVVSQMQSVTGPFGEGVPPSLLTSSFHPPPDTGLYFQSLSTLANGRQIAQRIADSSTILSNGNIHILRIYLPLNQLPPYCLTEMYKSIQQLDSSNPLREMQICICSHLRPCLQDIHEQDTLRQLLLGMVSDWKTVNTTIKFYFLHKQFPENMYHYRLFMWFVERDLMGAINGLRDGDVELSEILGDESIFYRKNEGSFDVYKGPVVGSGELDEEML